MGKDFCEHRPGRPAGPCVVFWTAVWAGSLLAAPAGSAVYAAQTYDVEVDTVVVNVLVSDLQGKPIAGLRQENFRLFEDKVEQQILNFFPVDAPFSVALLLDTSFSTVGKLARIQDAAIGFVREIHPDDEVMVISFDDEVYLDTDFTQNREEMERSVKGTRTGGSTQLFEAVYIALEELVQRPYRKVLILFTDGLDSASRTSMSETLDFAREADVTIYTIFFDTEPDALARLDPSAAPGGPLGTPGTIPGRNPGPMGTPGPGPFPMPMPAPLPPRQREPGEVGRRERESDEVRNAYRRARAYLDDLAESTGGARFEAGSNLAELSSAFAKIAEDMRSLYSLAYVSTNPRRDGRFREIRVSVDAQQGRVRARKGYYSRAE